MVVILSLGWVVEMIDIKVKGETLCNRSRTGLHVVLHGRITWYTHPGHEMEVKPRNATDPLQGDPISFLREEK